MTRILTAAAVVASFICVTGCTDLKPLQAEVDELRQQLSQMAADQHSMKSGIDSATRSASAAQTAAQQAQSRADAAALTAEASQQCCDATNDKIDRMFKRPVQK